MQLDALAPVVTAPGPFVTVHVPSESDVEQAADKYARQWKDIVRELAERGVDERTIAAVEAARGEHSDGASRLVVASTVDPSVRLAVSLDTPPRRPVVDVAPLPHLLPLVDELAARVPYVVVVADREGAEVWATDGADEASTAELNHRGTGEQPVSRGQARRDQRSVNASWHGTAKDAASNVEALAKEVDAQLVLVAGDTKIWPDIKGRLPAPLQEKVVVVQGTRNRDGSEGVLRQEIAAAVARHVASATLDLLADYAQERGQIKRACDGVADVVAALRKAQVQTLLLTTAVDADRTLWFGPDPSHIGLTAQEVRDLGTDDVQQGPLIDVLIRSAIGTGADVQVVPAEPTEAPAGGVGAVLRYADSL